MATPNDSGDKTKGWSLRKHLKSFNEDIFAGAAFKVMNGRPSEGSTFFKDCLVELRELSTSADFVSFYEELLPYAQTQPLVKLQKEMIFSKLVSGLQMKTSFSLEPILRLIAALSKDLFKDFIPFLPRIVNSFVILLNNGGQKDPEIIEQIFTSWSKIMTILRFYLTRDIEGILRDTVELRYYPNDCISEKMLESMSSLWRNARATQLEKGIKRILSEVEEQPERAERVCFLYYDMVVLLQQS